MPRAVHMSLSRSMITLPILGGLYRLGGKLQDLSVAAYGRSGSTGAPTLAYSTCGFIADAINTSNGSQHTTARVDGVSRALLEASVVGIRGTLVSVAASIA